MMLQLEAGAVCTVYNVLRGWSIEQENNVPSVKKQLAAGCKG